jgi:ferrochelatase
MSRLAVVLFNLGGPDGPDAVRPFLFNLFRDKAIIGAPAPIRYPLAAFISATRAKGARANYAIMGGGSPLLPETRRQAEALEAELNRSNPGRESRVFIAMRYWKPFAAETAQAVAAWNPDEIVLLPLYPQYSSTTSESSLADWERAYRGPGRTRAVCCYPTVEGLVEAHARAIRSAWEAGGRPEGLRLLFSAHGLPENIVAGGDPYQVQIEATAAAVAARLPELPDWRISYQSRVGPLKWIGPATDDEIRRAGAEGRGVIVSPIAFVSEHVETLVELDHEYAELAHEAGCPVWIRAATPSVDADFIGALGGAVDRALGRSSGPAPDGGWTCPPSCKRCPVGQTAKKSRR